MSSLTGDSGKKKDRHKTSEYFKSLDIAYEWHYMDTSAERRSKNIEIRNQAVCKGTSSDYYVDKGLLEKCNSLFESPSREEIDVWYKTK